MAMTACTLCGRWFQANATGGRPRSRCESCRTNHDRVDGTVWRKLRTQVLIEEPFCYFDGCGRRSTQVDHVLPLKLRPDLALERGNLRGICASHNASKGARLLHGQVSTVRHARVWVFPPTPERPYNGCQCGDRNCTATGSFG
jgi:5-methylcytosine-specific restriction endonuclease McrA